MVFRELRVIPRYAQIDHSGIGLGRLHKVRNYSFLRLLTKLLRLSGRSAAQLHGQIPNSALTLRRRRDLRLYVPWKKAPILLPLGPVKGSSFLILMTAGNWVTSKIKGQNLFLNKYNRVFGRS